LFIYLFIIIINTKNTENRERKKKTKKKIKEKDPVLCTVNLGGAPPGGLACLS
jgi:hypothetical protein